MNGSHVEGCCLDRNPTSISRRSAAGKVFRSNPSAAMSSRLRWHMSPGGNMAARSRAVFRGRGDTRLTLS